MRILSLASFGLLAMLHLTQSAIAGENEDLLKHPVIVQVCLPDKKVVFENVQIDLSDISPSPNSSAQSYNTWYTFLPKDRVKDRSDVVNVRKWISSQESDGTWYDGLTGMFVDRASAGSADFRLMGNTTIGQPVYDYDWHRPPVDLRGLEVIVLSNVPNSARNPIHYWFKLSTDVPHDAFSAWQIPISQETDADRGGETWFKLLNNKKIDIHPVTFSSAPLIRYMYLDKNDYLTSHRFPLRVQWAISMKNYSNITDEQRAKLGFASVFSEPIPMCEIQK
jgi:hypothetical protein